MNEQTMDPVAVTGRKTGFLAGLARRVVTDRLVGLRHGALIIREADQEWHFGQGVPVRMQVLDPRAWSAIAFGGTVGAGESYMDGLWRCGDLVGLVRLLLRNRAVLDGMEGGMARVWAPLRALFHRLNRNTRSGSRRNIAAHYDLGNAFYRLWLDETMMYSSAVFERPDMTLAQASVAKLERICRKLDLQPGDHVLEIGTGWGGFALHAARRHGARVTTATISRAQYDLARQRVADAGLADRVEVLLCDYRDLSGRYDKLVSIEMVEAVGAAYLDTYAGRCSRLLKPNGVMLLQAITIADQRYELALNEVDFIQKYIFPGGFLPSVTALSAAFAGSGDLRPVHLEDIGPHYAETLARWRTNFRVAAERVRELGFDERFMRMWDFYLCYCEGGFRERGIGTAQLLLAKSGWRGEVPGLAPPPA